MTDDEKMICDLIKDEVEREVERLKSIKEIGNMSIYSVYAEYIKQFKMKVYL